MTSAAAPQNSGTALDLAQGFLTVPEVANVLRTGVWQVAKLCRDGELRATKPGKQWLVEPADLQSYIDSGRNDQPEGVSA